ncbi:MAG: S41 family peptidase [Clostridia bacterium]|nr:S41 family peptidase [Clostridia bacterium]
MEEEKYIKRQRIYKTIMLVVLTAFITCIVTTAFISNKYKTGSNIIDLQSFINTTDKSDLTKTLKKIENIVNKYYLNDIDKEKAIDGAIKGYISALGDPYTEYVPANDMEEYTEALMGNFVGIGIYMIKNTEKNAIEVLAPIQDSPAEKAGILPEDIIVSVDGVKYTGDDMTTASNNIKGEEGTTVKLEILRGEEILNFELTRSKVTTNPVVSKKLENNIGYIEIPSFDEGTAEGFKTKFEGLKNEGINSLIIDLRNNGGGLVDEALKIADYIVPSGKELLITVDKDKKEKIEKAKEDVLIDMPIVLLVNENSASASEILAGALKDQKEATVVGTKTFGKGVIQQVLSLDNGSGLKITVEEYYTPNRNQINEIGIEPDETVELPETVTNVLSVEEADDTQLHRGIEILNKE